MSAPVVELKLDDGIGNGSERRDLAIVCQKISMHTEEIQTDLSALSEGESREYNRFRTDKRKREWLAGRLAVKNAVKRLGRVDPSLGQFNLSEITLRPSNGHPPQVIFPPISHGRLDVRTSISHSGDWAIACACLGSSPIQGIGVDLEKIDTPDLNILPIAFTAKEQELIRLNPIHYYRIWTAKEAVLKALGLGLTIDLRELEVENLAVRIGSNLYPVQTSRWQNYMISYCQI